MDFFKKTWVKIVAWVLLVAGLLVLMLGGIGAAEIGDVVQMVATIVAMVAALIAFIAELVKPK